MERGIVKLEGNVFVIFIVCVIFNNVVEIVSSVFNVVVVLSGVVVIVMVFWGGVVDVLIFWIDNNGMEKKVMLLEKIII